MKNFRDKLLGEFKKEATPKELKKYNDDRLMKSDRAPLFPSFSNCPRVEL